MSSLKGDRSAKSMGIYAVRVHEELRGERKRKMWQNSSHPEWFIDASFPRRISLSLFSAFSKRRN